MMQVVIHSLGITDSKLSFETLIDLELPILRRCGHTSTQTGWEGFVRCHQGSEIRGNLDRVYEKFKLIVLFSFLESV
jgi:hypothetical protein